MQRSLIKIVLFIIIFAFAFCDETSQEAEPEPLEFAMEPTEDLSFIVNEAPSDFTWEYFSENLMVSLIPRTRWSGEMVLTSVQVYKGEVENRSSTQSLSVTAGELSAGLSTEELFPGVVFRPGAAWASNQKWKEIARKKWPHAKQWINLEEAEPVEEWIPGSDWEPSEIENVVLIEVDLDENQSLLVVFARLAPDSPEREVLTQPYGIIFDGIIGEQQ